MVTQVKKMRSKPNMPEKPLTITTPLSIKSHEVEIDELDPIIALKKIHQEIENDKEALPILTKKTQKIVASYLNHLNKTNAEDAKIISTYERDTKIIYKRLKCVRAK